MDKNEALLKHLRDLAGWLEIQVREFEHGRIHADGGAGEQADIVASYRHKQRNVMAVVEAYNRLTAREKSPA